MESVWSKTAQAARNPRPALTGDLTTDVLIIGGGLAGLLTAYRLKGAGVCCAVVEAKTVGSGTTKNTTAKITAQHGLIYADLIRRSGAEKAKAYYESNARAVESFRTLAAAYPCDFEDKTAFVYSTGDRRNLEREAEAYAALGLPATIKKDPPLPLRTVGALAMEKQAQFHPLKLLYALADQVDVYENTFVHRLEGNTAVTHKGRITAESIVLATHFPLVNIPGLYFIKLYQHRSYALALEGAPSVGGMFVDEREDGLSFRNYQDLLLVVGGDHKTGKPGGGYDELRALAQRAYPKASERYHWAAQDCMTLDGIPYIGRHRAGKGLLFVATGFNKWGMTGAMTAAEMTTDLIVLGKSEWEALYSPRRTMLNGRLLVNLGSAVAGLAGVGGPRCAHMGCKLQWNDGESSWDCPCHGSRFDGAGRLIDNPAKRGVRL